MSAAIFGSELQGNFSPETLVLKSELDIGVALYEYRA
jgi:hypothetical protein